jgi:ATP-dependent Zn protease
VSEPKRLSEEAALEIRDAVHSILDTAMRDVAQMIRKNSDALVYMAPEVWDQYLDKVGQGVVNAALNVAWKDWNDE